MGNSDNYIIITVCQERTTREKSRITAVKEPILLSVSKNRNEIRKLTAKRDLLQNELDAAIKLKSNSLSWFMKIFKKTQGMYDLVLYNDLKKSDFDAIKKMDCFYEMKRLW